MARQRFIINTFANMNMMQQQMTSHMFGSLLKSQGPAPGSTEVNAMIRSMAKRQGYQGLTKPLNTPGQSYMNGAIDSALPYGAPSVMPGASAMPGLSAMHPAGMPQPGMSAFGSVKMPYLQMAGGAVPVPNSIMGGGTSFSMAGAGPGAPRGVHSMSTLRGVGSSMAAHGGGGSGGSTSGSAGRGHSRSHSRTRSHSRPRSYGGCSTPKTPTLGGPMHAHGSASLSRNGGTHRRSSSQRQPQMQPFGGASGYAASDGSRMLQPSSMGSEGASMGNTASSAFHHSGSLLHTSSSFQAPRPAHRSGGSAKAVARPASGPMVPYPSQRQPGFGSPDNSRRLSQGRPRRQSSGAPDQLPKPPSMHTRGKSANDPARRRSAVRGPSAECSPERSPDRHVPAAEPKRGRSSRMMAAVNAARRTLSGTRRRSSGRQRSSRHSSPNKVPLPATHSGPPTSGGSNRGTKPGPPPQPAPHGTQRTQPFNNSMMRSTTSSGPPSVVTNSSFLFDSASSGYSTQYDSLSSIPTSGSGSSAPQAPPTPPQPLPGHRRSKSGTGGGGGQAGAAGMPPLPPFQPAAVHTPPRPPAAASVPSQQAVHSGVYPGLMPQQIASPGVRRGGARRMTPQLAATPEVEEEISGSFM